MVTRVGSLVLAFLLSTVCSHAQPPDDRYLVAVNTPQWEVEFIVVNARGTVLGVHLTLPPQYMDVRAIVPAGDNEAFFVAAEQLGPSVLLRVQRNRGARIVAQAPVIESVVAGSEADEVFALVSDRTNWWLVHLRGAVVVATTAVPASVAGVLCFNPSQGYVVSRTASGYDAIDPASGRIHRIASRPQGWLLGITRYLCFDPRDNGEYVDHIQLNSPYSLLAWVDDATGAIRTTQLQGGNSVAVVRASDRAWPVRYRLFNKSRIQNMDASGQTLSWTLLNVNFAPGTPLVRLTGDPLNVRVVTPPNDRALELAFPYDGGRAYAVGLSLTGAAARASLPDGRPIPLEPDEYTAAALGDRLAPLVTGATGLLDASGRATVPIRANALGAAVRGRTIWATAIVLDAAAPSGVAHVTDPVRVELR